MFYNRILADRKPYFFRYKYKALAKEYNDYMKKNDQNCQIHYGITLKELLAKPKETLTDEEKNFLMYLDKYLPVIDSNCVMNNICKYVEGIDFHIKQKVRSDIDFDYKSLLSKNFTPNRLILEQLHEVIQEHFTLWEQKTAKRRSEQKGAAKNSYSASMERELEYQALKYDLMNVCSNDEMLANHLVYYFYVVKPSASKATLWGIAGKQIFENIKNKKTNEQTNTFSVDFPVRDENGKLHFQYNSYQVEHLSFDNNIGADVNEDVFVEQQEIQMGE